MTQKEKEQILIENLWENFNSFKEAEEIYGTGKKISPQHAASGGQNPFCKKGSLVADSQKLFICAPLCTFVAKI